MNFVDAVKQVFSRYATFTGRARRSEYWYFVLFTMIATAALGVFTKSTPVEINGQVIRVGHNALLGAFNLAVFLPRVAVTVRRLHDVGKSGWCWFWILFPIAGPIMLLIWLCREGEHRTNRFGPDPKAPADGMPWEY